MITGCPSEGNNGKCFALAYASVTSTFVYTKTKLKILERIVLLCSCAKEKNCAVTTVRFPELAIGRVTSLVSGQSLPRRRGNVRELQNYIERAVVLAQATELEPCLLPTTITGDHVESIAAPAGFPPARE